MIIWSGIRLVHHPEQVYTLRKSRSADPIHLLLDLTSRCNLACQWCCVEHEEGFDKVEGDLSIDRLQEVLTLFPDIKAVELTASGEPMAHPEFPAIINKVRDYDLGLKTNGVFIDTYLDLLNGFAWIRVSLDCHNNESYLKWKGKDEFSHVISNVVLLKERGIEFGMSAVIGEWNESNLIELSLLSRDVGAQYLRLMGDHLAPLLVLPLELVEKLNRINTESFKVVLETDKRSSEVIPEYCWRTALVAYCRNNGELLACCLNYRLKAIMFANGLKPIKRSSCFREQCIMDVKNVLIEHILYSDKDVNFM